MVSQSTLITEVEASPLLRGRYLAELTSRFVAKPSVNGEHPESELAALIAGELQASGYATTFVGDDLSRPSLAAVLGVSDEGVLLNGHLDTVPVDDPGMWRYEPFSGVIADGAVHGRGACDMKGGLAVQVAVAQWLARRELGRRRVVLHFAMGEERGEPGTESLLEAGFVAPVGLVLEPTDLQIGVAQRGLMTVRVIISGRAGHASRPDLADNPIRHLPAILGALNGLQKHAARRHQILGSPGWTPTKLRAGVIPSMVPGECELMIDRRMLPGETPPGVLTEIEEALRLVIPEAGVRIEAATEEGIYEPAEVEDGARSVAVMTAASAMLDETVTLFGTPYSSDIRHLINSAGVDALTYGPGRFSEMHARDEFVSITQLERAARTVASFCALVLQNR